VLVPFYQKLMEDVKQEAVLGPRPNHIFTIEEVTAAEISQKLVNDVAAELKAVDDFAAKIGFREEHVMELDAMFRVWDNDQDEVVSIDDVKNVLYRIDSDKPISEADEIVALFKTANVPYHIQSNIPRSRFLMILVKSAQIAFGYTDGIETRMLPIANDEDRAGFHRKLLKILTQGHRAGQISNETSAKFQKAYVESNNLLKDVMQIRAMLGGSGGDVIDKAIEGLSKLLSAFLDSNNPYVQI
jgi:hypothetical protein